MGRLDCFACLGRGEYYEGQVEIGHKTWQGRETEPEPSGLNH